MNNIFSKNRNESLYIHLSVSSFPYHHEEPHSLVSNLKVIEPKLLQFQKADWKRKAAELKHWPKKNYTFEHTTAEVNKGGTLLYIANGIRYKLRKDFLIYKLKWLELTFVELVNINCKNTIIGCVHTQASSSEESLIPWWLYISPFG